MKFQDKEIENVEKQLKKFQQTNNKYLINKNNQTTQQKIQNINFNNFAKSNIKIFQYIYKKQPKQIITKINNNQNNNNQNNNNQNNNNQNNNNQNNNQAIEPVLVSEFSYRNFIFLSNIFLGFQVDSYKKPQKSFLKQRDILIQTIQNYCKKRILRTKLLFEYQEIDRSLNFHNFIDDIPNYVLILKLGTGHIVAAYSQVALSNISQINNGPGFMINLTNNKASYVDTSRNGSRTTMYHQYFILFGNQDLRFSPAKRQTKSFNIGLYSFFRPRISNLELFGIQKQGVKANSYEVHKIIFQDKQ